MRFYIVQLASALQLLILCQAKDLDVSRELLENFIKDVKKKLNYSVDPCHSFVKFACSNVPKKYDTYYFFEELLIPEPRNELEVTIQDLYINETNKRYNRKLNLKGETKKMLKETGIKFLNSSDYLTKRLITKTLSDIIITYVLNAPSGALSFQIYLDELLISSSYTNSEEHIIKQLDILGILPEADKVLAFNNKISKLIQLYSKERRINPYVTINSIQEVKQLYPIKNLDLVEIFNSIKKNYPNLKDSVKIENDPEHLKKVFEIFDETEPHVIYNYYVLKLIGRLVFDGQSIPIYYYSKFAFLNRNWEGNFKNEPVALARYETFLNEIETVLKQLKMKHNIESKVENNYKENKNLILNFKEIITEDFLKKFYGPLLNSPNNFYGRLLTVLREVFKLKKRLHSDSLNENQFKIYVKNEKPVFLNEYPFMIDVAVKDQPFLNLYALKVDYLLKEVYSEIRFKKENFLKCAKRKIPSGYYLNEYYLFDYRINIKYIFDLATQKDTTLYAENEILKNINDEYFDFKKLYLTSLVQAKCNRGHNVDDIDNVLQVTPEFVEIFQCKPGSRMKLKDTKCPVDL